MSHNVSLGHISMVGRCHVVEDNDTPKTLGGSAGRRYVGVDEERSAGLERRREYRGLFGWDYVLSLNIWIRCVRLWLERAWTRQSDFVRIQTSRAFTCLHLPVQKFCLDPDIEEPSFAQVRKLSGSGHRLRGLARRAGMSGSRLRRNIFPQSQLCVVTLTSY